MDPLPFDVMLRMPGTLTVDELSCLGADESAPLLLRTVRIMTGHAPMDVLVILGSEEMDVAFGVVESPLSLLNLVVDLLQRPSDLDCKFKVLYGRIQSGLHGRPRIYWMMGCRLRTALSARPSMRDLSRTVRLEQ